MFGPHGHRGGFGGPHFGGPMMMGPRPMIMGPRPMVIGGPYYGGYRYRRYGYGYGGGCCSIF